MSRSACRHQPRRQPRVEQRGISLVETMVATAISATLAGVGVPSLTQFQERQAIDAQFHRLGASLRLARSEALTRDEVVSVCAIDPATADSGAPECRSGGKDWSGGWLVFVDRGQRGRVDEGDLVLKVHQAPAGSGAVLGTQRYLSYRATGVMLSIAAHFRFIPPGQPMVDEAVPGSALVCVNKPGKARLAKTADCDA
jgi:type IV fimbrial biogenesis protein FimT